MVFRLKETWKRRWKDLLAALFFTILLSLPYLTKDLLPVEHDTFFHVSRIEQLSRSIQEGHFFPAIYPYENNGYGYASPLFYSDFFLIIPALIHLCGIPVSVCYKISVFLASFFSAYTMILLAGRISHNRMVSWLAGAAYVFSNYHITDIYVRGAFGEVLAFVFLPVILLGFYEIMAEGHCDKWKTLCLGIAATALSHNLTFLMSAFLLAILFFLSYRKWTPEKVSAITKAVILAFFLTCFFTLPMLEQLKSQDLIVSYYGETSDLSSGSMNLWQYFVNRTVFGFSGNNLPHDQTMTVNVGWFLTFAPLSWFLVKKEYRKEHSFVTIMVILGYICLLLPGTWMPWNALSFLKVMQFPWRFNTMTITLLSVPAAMGICSLLKKKGFHLIILSLLCVECIYHVLPVEQRTFGITSDMTWQDILHGKICDPYYSASYIRVELAGGDYLPVSSPDFRGRSTDIKDGDDQDLGIEYNKNGTTMSFNVPEKYTGDDLILPLTWYKGYQVYHLENGDMKKVPTFENHEGMVTFTVEEEGTYMCMYEDTPLRRICILISWAALIVLMTDMVRDLNHKHD